MGCAPTAVIGPTRAARPIGHHCWKKYILLPCDCPALAELFSAQCFGDGTETSSSGQLSALRRVISPDLIDLDAHVGTRVRSVFGDRRVAGGLDLRRGPAADSNLLQGEGTGAHH